MQQLDIWILGFERRDEDPADALARVFGVSLRAAMEIELSVPVAVKRGLSESESRPFVVALEGIGARIELRPARAASGASPRPSSLEAPRPAFASASASPAIASPASASPASASPAASSPPSVGVRGSDSAFPPVPEWGELPALDEAPDWGPPNGAAGAALWASTTPSSAPSTPPTSASRSSHPPAWGPPLALAEVPPTRRSSRPASLSSEPVPRSVAAPVAATREWPEDAPSVLGQLLGGLAILVVGIAVASFGWQLSWRIGSFLSTGSGAGMTILAIANLVRIFVFRGPAWNEFLPRAAAYTSGFGLVALITFQRFFSPPSEEEIVALEVERVREIESAPEASDYLRQNPTHHLGSLSPAQSAQLLDALRGRGASSVKVLPDEVFGPMVTAIVVHMPESSTQRLFVRQAVWNAIRNDAQANGFVFEDLDVDRPDDVWWTVWLTFD